MHLKTLELVGFKSFGKRVKMVFEPGLIAIVGPNGSGKSNIVDAIRWVLGEQSMRSLRGDQLDDVIFAGTKQERPLGMAKVELTLDNSDGELATEFSEVSVCRTVYRSGESQFMINRQSCRLRDIQELFMGTGLGKDGYGIIGQGQVDAFLAASPAERRLVLEEVAGISLFQRKKTDALRRLGQTGNTLVRVQDLLSELVRQLEPLAVESQRAQRYNELKKQLEETELQIFAFQINSLSSDMEKTRQSLATEESLTTQTEASLEEVNQRLIETRQQAASHAATYEKHQAHLYELGSFIEKNSAEISVIEERKERYLAELVACQRGSATAQDELAKLKVELAQARELQRSLEEERSKYIKQSKAIKDDKTQRYQALQETERNLDHLQKSLTDLANQEAVLHEKLKAAQINQAEKQRYLQQLEKAEEELESSLKGALALEEHWGKVLEGTQNELSETQNALLNQENSMSQLQKQLEITNDRLAKSREYLQRERARHQTLKDLQQSSYFQGVRAVLEASMHGIVGTVGDLITVPQEYETALEVALGNNIQNIVTETVEGALRAVEYLKASNNGRATFLPLEILRPERPPRLQEFPGFIGLGSDLVQLDPEYEVVIRYLLGRVMVVETLQYVKEVLGQIKGRVRFVTLDGDYVSPGGAITGGTPFKDQSGLLARRRLLEESKDIVHGAQRAVEALTREKTDMEAELAGLREQYEDLRKRRERLLLEQSEAQHQWASSQDHLARLRKNQEEKRQERFHQEELESVLSSSFDALRSKLCEVQDGYRVLLGELECGKTKERELRKEIGDLDLAFTEVAVHLAKLNERVEKCQQDSERQAKRLHGLRQRVDESATTVRGLQEQINRAEKQKNECERRGAELAEQQRTTAEWLEDVAGKRQQAADQQAQLEARIKELQQELEHRKQGVNKLHLRLNELGLRLEQAQAELQDKYGLPPEESARYLPLQEPLGRAKEQVLRLKEELRSLGSVDNSSIERYHETKKRHDFLSEQYHDLVAARSSIEKLINQIQRECDLRFMETFDQVKTEFSKTFKRLFNGGTADLVLIEEEDNSVKGLEVLVSPPGKKIQNINLLSGGERALTGIAFLMSVLQVRPTPFCILDEIDAALDEANLERFVRLVRESATKVQFLVITHRPPTMEAADILYGITMQESGVSKVVSLKMTEAAS
ncbi:MAG: chromosome segregation protein SMC [Limnochordia bacterium]|nr:chromosome segregation protein SMC [Limnochordia bacterium]MDD2628667.1 chromosome segregation protein SMC [Limnochordia bacterium]MDD4516894.1 chromosome segregation protein SMC [Limnochordia bacterium]